MFALGVAGGCATSPPPRAVATPEATTAGGEVAGTGPVGPGSREALEAFDRTLAGGSAASQAEALSAASARSPAEERPFVLRVARLLGDLGAQGGDPGAQAHTTSVAFGELYGLTTDPEVRAGVALRAVAMAVTGPGDPGASARDAAASELAARAERDHPDDPRALVVRANALRRLDGDLRGALARARRCATALPACEELARTIELELSAPRCAGTELRPGFALHRGTRAGPHDAAPRLLDVGGAPFFAAASPAITGDDVEEVVADGTTLLVVLRRSSEPALAPFLRQDAGADAAAVVLIDGRPVGVAGRLLPMRGGKLLLPSEPGSPLRLTEVCAAIHDGLGPSP